MHVRYTVISKFNLLFFVYNYQCFGNPVPVSSFTKISQQGFFFPHSLLIPLSMLSLCIPCLNLFVNKDFNKKIQGAHNRYTQVRYTVISKVNILFRLIIINVFTGLVQWRSKWEGRGSGKISPS